MLSRFRPKPEPRFLPGRVGFAVGDVHGRLDLLERMLDRLERDGEAARAATGADPIVVFLGDYIDRGPASAGVIGALLQRPVGFERRFLMGNHEQAMREFLRDPASMRGWLTHGGLDTLASYGVRPPPPRAPADTLLAAADAFAAVLPPEHRAFLERLEPYVILGDYLFVHAGVAPDRPIEAQSEAELFWIRRPFLESDRRYSHIVVHGHTPQNAPSRDRRRIGLDTGAYATGLLSAARFEGADVSLFSVRMTD